jgi:hypothetical protein
LDGEGSKFADRFGTVRPLKKEIQCIKPEIQNQQPLYHRRDMRKEATLGVSIFSVIISVLYSHPGEQVTRQRSYRKAGQRKGDHGILKNQSWCRESGRLDLSKTDDFPRHPQAAFLFRNGQAA